eukprot:TRINITY_DN7641_c0_g1_i5.p1 TRINITY_DN7641_c0_g1~~TRINITY_DN7641_c0_g1_i5.p1  ORF type:complete len:441 (+),score=61.28 TRINITY_DN7641_c0_g1_i5:44-1366(+)
MSEFAACIDWPYSTLTADMTENVPGSLGLPLFGDQSMTFYRDPIQFVEKQCSKHGPLFQARLLNTATVFITEHETARTALSFPDEDLSSSSAYRPFMSKVYGDNNIILAGSEAHSQLSCSLMAAFSPAVMTTLRTNIDAVVKDCLKPLECLSEPIDLYQKLKGISTTACFRLLLELQTSDPLNAQLSELATEHWHGITSLPATFNLGFGIKSTMSRSMEAKEKLLEIIETRIRMLDASEDGLLHRLSKELDMPPNECAQQLLLLVSALVPKAFSSILTTLIRHLSLRPSWEVEDHLDDEAWLASAIQEAHRLEPPFIAMRRVVTKAGGIRLGNYRIPQDTVVMIMLPTVNRDGTIYSDPDSFDPTRFLHDTATPPLTFGYGARPCVGQGFVQALMISMTQQLLKGFDFDIPDIDHVLCETKWLPVARPAKPVMAYTFDRV